MMENDNQEIIEAVPEPKGKPNKALWITLGLFLLLLVIGLITYFSLASQSKQALTPTPTLSPTAIPTNVPTLVPTITISSPSATPKITQAPTLKITAKPSPTLNLSPTAKPSPTSLPTQY